MQKKDNLDFLFGQGLRPNEEIWNLLINKYNIKRYTHGLFERNLFEVFDEILFSSALDGPAVREQLAKEVGPLFDISELEKLMRGWYDEIQ